MTKQLLILMLVLASISVASAAPASIELMICNSANARGTEVQCIRNGEKFNQAPPTTLFALYEQGWRLIATQAQSVNAREAPLSPHVFFLERPKD